MTDNEIRIAVAEACGWRRVENADGDLCGAHLTRSWVEWHGPKGQIESDPPDYPNDLNAMHAAWLTLSKADRVVFAETLFAITKGDVVNWGYYPGEMEINWDEIGTAINATARLRAEAFLRTIGKWKTNQHLLPKSKNKNRS